MSQFPPSTPGQMTGLRPHRGTMILVLGILGLVLCVICGIVAWIMGSSDIRDMEAGRMDPSGLGMTKAGKICGMVGVALNLIAIVLWVLIVGMAVIGGAAGAGRP